MIAEGRIAWRFLPSPTNAYKVADGQGIWLQHVQGEDLDLGQDQEESMGTGGEEEDENDMEKASTVSAHSADESSDNDDSERSEPLEATTTASNMGSMFQALAVDESGSSSSEQESD